MASLALLSSAALPAGVLASTTTDSPSWCRYTDSAGKVRFDGKCTINFGVGPAWGCSDRKHPKTLVAREILEFSKTSQAEIRDYCDGTETVNGTPSSYGDGTWNGKPVLRVLTRNGELFEYYPVDENTPGTRGPTGDCEVPTLPIRLCGSELCC